MVRLSQRLLVVFASAVLFVSACTAENVEGKNDLASEQAQDSALEVDELGLCDQVAAGYIIQVNDGDFEVCPMAATYQASTGSLTSAPSTSADFGLSVYGVGATQSGTTLNHPASGASDGKHLAVADRFNNRVLIFATLPTGPAEPDVVVGQPNFTDTTPGSGMADLNWPGAVEMTPDGKLLIADTENGRILVYRSVPTENGAEADFAIDFAGMGDAEGWPWGIWSDGTNLVVTDTRRGAILVWDSFPLDGNSRPTFTSKPQGVGTPRNITSDGTNFLIGDENGSQAECWGEALGNRNRQSHIWVNRLPIGDPDGCIWDWYQGDVGPDGLIALAAGGQDAHYWPDFPSDNQTAMSKFQTGAEMSGPPPEGDQPGPPSPGEPPTPGDPQPGDPQPQNPSQPSAQSEVRNTVALMSTTAHSYLGGDGGDVVITEEAIYFIEYNGNRVTGWTSLPDDVVGKVPDFSVFDADPDVSTLLRDGFIQNPVLVNANGALVATSDYDRRIYMWNEAPGEDGAGADYIYLTGFPAWDNTFADGTLIIAGRDSLAIWENFAPGDLPTSVYRGSLGSVVLSDLKGVAYDGTYLAISDGQTNTVSVFEGLPDESGEPVRSYSIQGPGRLDMKDGVLVIAPKEGAAVLTADIKAGGSPQTLPIRANLPQQAKFLPFGFAVADTSFHRVQLWNSLADAQAGKEPASIIGGEIGDRPQTTADGLYFPASVEVVAGNLYVGEFKFSNRILAYGG